jgi:hypothetical protein
VEGLPWREAVAAVLESTVGEAAWDTLELGLTHASCPVDLVRASARFANVQRGWLGLEVETPQRRVRLAPSQMIAANLDFPTALQRAIAGEAARAESFDPVAVRVVVFEAITLLIRPDDDEPIVRLHRGDRLLGLEDATEGEAAAALERILDWFVANQHPDGRLPYKYWPSRGEWSEADNTVRQFLATHALGVLGRATGRADVQEAAARNLEANLRAYFRVADGGLGAIELEGHVKLGAVALAGLAIHESPARERFADEAARLLATTDALWQSDGSFQTFLWPRHRKDGQNFYPGETLLWWAEVLAETRDLARLERIQRSLAFYQGWHAAQPNPAFVPWHVMAHARLWDTTRDAALVEPVLRMADWLLPLQQRFEAADTRADLDGRFYDPRHPEYGPPHASSTGVYVEGLAEACRVARAVGCDEAASRYQAAIQRGVRNLIQLQFRDETGMFYVHHRQRVRGAIRTEAYDNALRIDNMQHAALALWKSGTCLT